jgi:hypothetical protein
VARYAFGPHGPGPGLADHAPRLFDIARAYRRDPSIAERLARERVAGTVDAALAHAELGRMFDALGDPYRARLEWQAAVDSSSEPAFELGLALAAARAGDAPAAMVFGTKAAAACGDPVSAWTRLARTLEERGLHVDALAVARSAMELAGRMGLAHAVDVAIEASRALGREAQARALEGQRAQLPRGPRDIQDALAAHGAHPTAETVARLWVVSRSHSQDVATRSALMTATLPGDPRREQLIGELVELAGATAEETAFSAVRALAP